MERTERLFKAMKHLNLSSYRVQKDLGLSSGTFTHYRKGINHPRESTLEAFARAYGISIHWLLTGEGDMSTGKILPAKAIRFLKVIEQVKIDNGLTNRDLADKFGSYESLISELKAGKTSVKDEWIDTLQDAYGVNREYITDGAGAIYHEQVTDGRTYRELIREVELLRGQVLELKRDKLFLQSIIQKADIKVVPE